MAALVQTYPQHTGTITMLQTRPSSNPVMMPVGQPQQNHPYMGHPSQAPRSPSYGNSAPVGYRGASAPIQPYAFASAPNLNQNLQWQQGQFQPVLANQVYGQNVNYRGRFPNNAPAVGFGHTHSMGVNQGGSRDDSAISARNPAPVSRLQPTSPSFTPSGQSTKAAPDRYRRPAPQPTQHGRSQSSSLPSTAALSYNGPNNGAMPSRPTSFYATVPASMDDMQVVRPSSHDGVNRMRRRSMHSLETDFSPLEDVTQLANTLRVVPSTTHSRTGSSESVSSSRSSHSRPSSATNRGAAVPTGNPSLPASDETPVQDQPKLINIPARGSSTDAAKRTLTPSPLSKPATMAADATEESSRAAGQSATAAANLTSPAARQLAALNQKGGRSKTKTSRLRRAFSFGSAAEFRQANGPELEKTEKVEPVNRLHKDPNPDEAYDAEQARIAEAQEAAGLGNSIYGGRFFGSTDNLSISSTASSASIMIRKMGRGMKKGGRSLVGIFRPKSVIGVPASDALAPEATQAEVSMITVEAETQRVNVNPELQVPAGGTDFPHLERNSIDTAHVPEMTERLGSSGADSDSTARKSIVGGDRERAEVLAAVRKGILKRSSSPTTRQADASPGLDLPNVPAIADSPMSSAPSTPNDDAQGHRRTGSVSIGNEDYFMTALRLRQDTKSAPGTPQGGSKRNATFSPRLIFHDTWPSQEYDRRGEIATCNRLTPMLAQQIKEELNTFKMEMEVHENSKIYTHFF